MALRSLYLQPTGQFADRCLGRHSQQEERYDHRQHVFDPSRHEACSYSNGRLGSQRVSEPNQQFWYFQFRCLPSAIHSTACATLLSLVSARFASTIHSVYSR